MNRKKFNFFPKTSTTFNSREYFMFPVNMELSCNLFEVRVTYLSDLEYLQSKYSILLL